ncbi:unnamed protein product [Ceutorhynchus assimilis]|uniref:SWIM-type domain-containing protein n=1 Tax=Ceutorhynchus assimilis TaxID=467358 RepID=A0A9N9QDH1_9CUCU|nr:unnamed protein product [Ceutorhynchus assimilis]
MDNQMVQASKNISINEIAKNTYRVSSSTNKTLFYTANTDISFCDCVHGQGGCFCKHLCAFQQKLGIVFKSAPTLTLEDKDFAKVALGDDVSMNFFEFMDTDVIVQRQNEQESLQTIENEENKSSPKLGDISNSNNNLDDEAHSTAVAGLSQQFQRITNIAANSLLLHNLFEKFKPKEMAESISAETINHHFLADNLVLITERLNRGLNHAV